MSTLTHYIVDVYVENDSVTEEQLDTALGLMFQQLYQKLDLTVTELEYDLVNMGVEEA